MRPVGARLLHLLLLYRYTSQTVSYFDRISRGHTRAHHIHCLRLKGRLRCPAVTLTATVDYVAWTIRTLRSRLLYRYFRLRFGLCIRLRVVACTRSGRGYVEVRARREWLAGSFSKAPSIEQALSVKL